MDTTTASRRTTPGRANLSVEDVCRLWAAVVDWASTTPGADIRQLGLRTVRDAARDGRGVRAQTCATVDTSCGWEKGTAYAVAKGRTPPRPVAAGEPEPPPATMDDVSRTIGRLMVTAANLDDPRDLARLAAKAEMIVEEFDSRP